MALLSIVSVILQKEKLLLLLEENDTFSRLLMHAIFVTTPNFALLTANWEQFAKVNLIKNWKMLQFLGA